MDLERSKRTMRRVADRDQVAVEDVLNVFYDVCQDIKDGTGSAVDKLPCLDESELYRRLPWLARTVLRICRQNESRISDEGRKAHLKELEEDVARFSAQLDRGAVDLKEVLEKKKAAEDVLSCKTKELESIRQETQKAEAETQQLQIELEEARQKLDEEQQRKEQELTVLEEGLHALEKEREEKRALLAGEEAQCAKLQSDVLWQEIHQMVKRTDRLAALREKLTSEYLPEGAGQDASDVSDITQAFDAGLKQTREQLAEYSRILRNYADALSDM